jgi:hypothetical protein
MFICFKYLLTEIDASRVARVIVEASQAAWVVVNAIRVK